MAVKKAVLGQLADYFAKKGQMMSPTEYKAADDAPIRFMVAKRPFGSWARMQQMIQANFPVQWEKANNVAPAPKVAAPKAKAKAAAPKAKAKIVPKKTKK
jgi:hypothetical protein